MIINKNALEQINDIYNKNKGKILFFSMNKTGCSGYEFIIKLEDLLIKNEKMKKEYHLDLIIGIDIEYIEKLNNTTLDFEKNKMESKFVFSNVEIQSYCGCGKSFNFK